jgi:transposase-like protein
MPRPSFPKSLPEFQRMFPDEAACVRYLVDSRWPDGWRCPRCGDAERWECGGRIEGAMCRKCRYLSSLTAGTVLHKTRTPLSVWFLAAWLVVTDKRGVSAYQLERQLGLRHETAFQMLHKLRAGMVAPDREMLCGVVELDESCLGSPKRGRPVKEVYAKTWIVGAVEVRERRREDKETGEITISTYPGRLRMRHVPGRRHDDLLLFAIENVAEGSTVVTDDLSHYKDLPLAGYKRRVESTAHGLAQDEVLTHYHLVISNLKAWLAGTHHGRVEPKHLQAYLNEWTFRFNRRGNLHAAFQRLLGIASHVRGPEYEQLYADEGDERGWEHPSPAGRVSS